MQIITKPTYSSSNWLWFNSAKKKNYCHKHESALYILIVVEKKKWNIHNTDIDNNKLNLTILNSDYLPAVHSFRNIENNIWYLSRSI